MNAHRIGLAGGAVLVLAGGLAGAALTPLAAQPAEPAVRGKVLFLQCAACHSNQPGAPAKVGPNLAGVVGRKSGSAAGFRYSAAMAKASLTWNEATLDKWLSAPARLVPGTTMAFGGVAKPEDRQALIAYLKKGKP